MFAAIRRSLTNSALHGVLRATGRMPESALRFVADSVGSGAATALRGRLRTNMELGLGAANVPAGAVEAFFRRFRAWAYWSMCVFHRTSTGSGLADRVTLHDSIAHLDEAVARGKGVVLAAPHVFGHELGAGVISQRHRVVCLVREASRPHKQAIKMRWYDALGVDTQVIARDLPVSAVVRKCLRLLREGRVVGITPDLVVSAAEGMPVRFLGRRVHVKAGLVALALMGRAPLVTCLGDWSSPRGGELTFTEPLTFERPRGGSADDVDAVMQAGLQRWFDGFETYLRTYASNWLFWLDKRWTRVLRDPAHLDHESWTPGVAA